MPLISSPTIIRSISLFHLTISFYLLTSPSTIADQTIILILGEAMKLPPTRTFTTPSPALSFLAILFAYIGLTDLISISQPPEISLYHWGSQAPIRFFLTFCLSAYSFMFSAQSPLMGGKAYEKSAWGEGLKNRVFFTWAFVEMCVWFWVLLVGREERGEMARVREVRRREREERELL